MQTPSPAVAVEQIADLNLRNCVEQTLSDKRIPAPGELSSLICTHAGIESLVGLEQFSNLQQIDFGDNALTRVEVLYELPALRYVNLEGNPQLSCADVKTLAALPREGLEVVQPEHCR
ncbi:leucine-rich repeat domain-containing protein [Proteobacteria bacterium 005FR1]|nr:leucine-rich repeat domain-containing protein [Proteobacteria bacterium 005FR1]